MSDINVTASADNTFVIRAFNVGSAVGDDGRAGIVVSIICEEKPGAAFLVFPNNVIPDFLDLFIAAWSPTKK